MYQAVVMNLKHLAAALAVQQTGSITSASEKVFLTQSAVSQAIKGLEHDLGHRLFITSGAGATATEGGQRFLNRVTRALGHLRDIEELVSRSSGERRHIKGRVTASHLRALVEVAELHSYSAAAVRLGVSQPSVHKAIKSLEEVCGIRLFKRRPRGVDPSLLARQIAVSASLCFAELDQGTDELEEQTGITGGRLRIGALPLAQASIVPSAALRILKRFPHSRISIVDGPYEEQLKYLIHGKIDIIIGALRNPQPSHHIIQEQLFSDPLCIVTGANHPMAKQLVRSAEQLQKLRWIAPRPGTPARKVFEHYFSRAGMAPPPNFIECGSLVTIRGLLMNSDFAALLPAKQVELDVATGSLAISPQPLTGTSRDIGLAYRKDWVPTALQKEFITTVRRLVRGDL